MLSFGIEEAKRAEEFAKTDEQKQTVLAVVRMMNIPIVVNKQASKQVKKLSAKIDYDNIVVRRLNTKIEKFKDKVQKYVSEKDSIKTTSVDWSL